MKKFLPILAAALMIAATLTGCTQQRQWNQQQRLAMRESLNEYRDMVYLKDLTDAEFRAFKDKVTASLEHAYPAYNSYTKMSGRTDTLNRYVVREVVSELKADPRNLRHIFPYQVLVVQGVIPDNLSNEQQHQFYRSFAKKVDANYPSKEQFYRSMLNESGNSRQMRQWAAECSNDLYDWEYIDDESDYAGARNTRSNRDRYDVTPTATATMTSSNQRYGTTRSVHNGEVTTTRTSHNISGGTTTKTKTYDEDGEMISKQKRYTHGDGEVSTKSKTYTDEEGGTTKTKRYTDTEGETWSNRKTTTDDGTTETKRKYVHDGDGETYSKRKSTTDDGTTETKRKTVTDRDGETYTKTKVTSDDGTTEVKRKTVTDPDGEIHTKTKSER